MFGYKPITDVDDEFEQQIFDEKQIDTLKAIWDAYGIYDAKYLEELTHQEDPWKEARGTCAPGDRCTSIITIESMKEFYSKF